MERYLPDKLNSWKEIARYLDRGIRTVQRWERDLALPIRRANGAGHSAVTAIRSELDQWMRSRPSGKPVSRNGFGGNGDSSTIQLVKESRRIYTDFRETTRQFRDTITSFRLTVQEIMRKKGAA